MSKTENKNDSDKVKRVCYMIVVMIDVLQLTGLCDPWVLDIRDHIEKGELPEAHRIFAKRWYENKDAKGVGRLGRIIAALERHFVLLPRVGIRWEGEGSCQRCGEVLTQQMRGTLQCTCGHKRN